MSIDRLRSLRTIAVLVLALFAAPLVAQPAGEYLGHHDDEIGATLLHSEKGPVWVLIDERTHQYRVTLADGTHEVVARYQYSFLERPPMGADPSTSRVIYTSPLYAERLTAADFDRPRRGPDPDDVVPVDDPVQDVIDELEGYRHTLKKMKARATGLDKVKLCAAIADIDIAIAGLRNLPGGEGEIEEALDWAIRMLCDLEPKPNSSLERIKNALINLRMHLF